VNLETLRPEPSVEGFTTPAVYSCKAVMRLPCGCAWRSRGHSPTSFPAGPLSGIGPELNPATTLHSSFLLGCDTGAGPART